MRTKMDLKHSLAAALMIALTAVLLNGCALFALPTLEAVGTTAGSAGSGISGVMGTESTLAVNKSWDRNNNEQAKYYRQQVEIASRQRQERLRQRSTAVGILNSMATLDGDPQIADLANWVKAGGDPKFALNYALARDSNDIARRQAVEILDSMSEREDNPTLLDLANWVRAGGDEKLALNYALEQRAGLQRPQASRRRTELPEIASPAPAQ